MTADKHHVLRLEHSQSQLKLSACMRPNRDALQVCRRFVPNVSLEKFPEQHFVEFGVLEKVSSELKLTTVLSLLCRCSTSLHLDLVDGRKRDGKGAQVRITRASVLSESRITG